MVDVLSLIFTFLLTSSITTIVVIIGYFGWRWWLYRKITYEINWLRSEGIQVQIDKAKEEKTTWGKLWKTKKTKKVVPIPPPDCISLDIKGKKVVRAYWTEQGDVTYSKPTKEGFEAIHGTEEAQRIIYSEQVKKNLYRSQRFWQQYGFPIVFGGFILVLITVTYIFWDDLIQPAKEFQAGMSGVVKEIKEVMVIAQQICSEKQTIPNQAPPTK